MKKWQVQKTILIVGEGATEKAFLTHIKHLFSPRGNGVQITIKNAKGKGEKQVVEWTIRQIGIASYHKVAVLLDTDTTCWTESVSKRAKQNKIMILESKPNIEAMLLRVLGESDRGTTKILKKRFAPFVNSEPTSESNYIKYFDKNRLLATREHTIRQLLDELLEIEKII